MPISEDTAHELLLHLRDTAYLSAHPLAQRLDPEGTNRGERLRRLLLELIDDLRPPPGTAPDDPSWRPHQVLRLRYVEQLSPLRVQESLSLSERQVRRERSRAIAALTAMLQTALPDSTVGTSAASPAALTQAAAALHMVPTVLDVREELAGVSAVLAPRLAECHVLLDTRGIEQTAVFADRVALRQVLIRAIGALAGAASGATIRVEVKPATDAAIIRFRAESSGRNLEVTLGEETVSECDYMAGLSHGRVWQECSENGTWVCCRFAAHHPVLILVIDDEAAAVHLIRRYVQALGYRVVGLEDPKHAYAVTIDLHPDVILLDVLMSGRDGWEVLQQLKALPETADVPIIVCSVWNEPELAESLGASVFIRKPVTRSVLLAALQRVLPN